MTAMMIFGLTAEKGVSFILGESKELPGREGRARERERGAGGFCAWGCHL